MHRQDRVSFNEQEMKYLNQLFLSHERGKIRYYNKHNAAPTCVLQFLQHKLEDQLTEIEGHKTGTQPSTMSEHKMKCVIEGALKLPYPEIKQRATQLLKEK